MGSSGRMVNMRSNLLFVGLLWLGLFVVGCSGRAMDDDDSTGDDDDSTGDDDDSAGDDDDSADDDDPVYLGELVHYEISWVNLYLTLQVEEGSSQNRPVVVGYVFEVSGSSTYQHPVNGEQTVPASGCVQTFEATGSLEFGVGTLPADECLYCSGLIDVDATSLTETAGFVDIAGNGEVEADGCVAYGAVSDPELWLPDLITQGSFGEALGVFSPIAFQPASSPWLDAWDPTFDASVEKPTDFVGTGFTPSSGLAWGTGAFGTGFQHDSWIASPPSKHIGLPAQADSAWISFWDIYRVNDKVATSPEDDPQYNLEGIYYTTWWTFVPLQ
jgi:hypothetical protein